MRSLVVLGLAAAVGVFVGIKLPFSTSSGYMVITGTTKDGETA